jgi:dGTPase
MYTANDFKRLQEIDDSKKACPPYRHHFRRDYSRLLHSAAFRRLQGKTQLFPGPESDFFRNRLTHSLEVAQIGKSIATLLNDREEFLHSGNEINVDLIEFAGLAHDLGHPPFGHNGEMALDECMKSNGGYEGNAQTLRILSKLEKKEVLGDYINVPVENETGEDKRIGLNLTYRTLASILKYDRIIAKKRNKRSELSKGYYYFDKDLVEKIKENVIGVKRRGEFKTVECSIMDIADDIAYSTYDLEDAMKAGFLNHLDFLGCDDNMILQIMKKLKKEKIYIDVQEIRLVIHKIFGQIYAEKAREYLIHLPEELQNEPLAYIDLMTHAYNSSKEYSQDGYIRTFFTSTLIDIFISSVVFEPNEEHPCLSKVHLSDEKKIMVEVLKQFVYLSITASSRLKVPEHRGKDIVIKLFNAIKSNPNLLPDDFKNLFNAVNGRQKDRIICDFIAGMTDRYAVEFYCRLFSENHESIFKPL